jgi:hypothetical protein
MEIIDWALDYLKDHKLVAALMGVLFVLLLIRNFWFLVKLLVVLAIGVVAVSVILSLIGKATKEKKDLLRPGKSSRMEHVISVTADWHHPPSYYRLMARVSLPFTEWNINIS